jgi:hypothetical protein
MKKSAEAIEVLSPTHRLDRQIVGHARRDFALIGSFGQKLFFSLIPESVRPTARFTGLFPKVIRAGADFILAQIAHAFTSLGLAAVAELLANRGDRVADLANRSLNVLRGRAQTAAPEPHLAGLSQVDLAAYPRACTTRSGMRS